MRQDDTLVEPSYERRDEVWVPLVAVTESYINELANAELIDG